MKIKTPVYHEHHSTVRGRRNSVQIPTTFEDLISHLNELHGQIMGGFPAMSPKEEEMMLERVLEGHDHIHKKGLW